VTKSPKTDLGRKRADWWARHVILGMPIEDAFKRVQELAVLYALTPAERERKWGKIKDIPEFAL